jgi:phage terminase large subunit-like protein
MDEDEYTNICVYPCCSSWVKAHTDGTDNEGYMQLVWNKRGVFYIGDTLPPVIYCPWCGYKQGE